MVKAVVGEDTRLTSVEDRLSHSAIPAEVGLVIGKLSSVLDRGFVFDLIPTPSNDDGEPACSVLETKDDKRKPSKSKSESSSLSIDSDWVAEHARQVSRMLLGGMKVVGIYVWASDAAFKNSTMILCQAIKGVTDAIRHLDPSLDEALLIHICYSPRRWSCRTCLLSSSITSSSLRPCDFKLGRVLSSLQRFKCSYSFNFRLPIYREGESTAQSFTDILRRELAIHAKELKSANAMVDGDLVHNDEPCNTDGEHEVELLFPFMKDSRAEALTAKNITGILLFGGSIFSYAYLNMKEPVSQAITDIKADIIRSLQSRLDIICDEAEQDVIPKDVGDDEDANEMSKIPISKLIFKSSTKICHLRLPRRVLVPWLADMYICDYLQPFESHEVVKERCIELMSMEHSSIDASKISEVETETSLLIAESMWDVISHATSASNFRLEGNVERTMGGDERKRTSNAGGNASNVPILVGIFVLLLSIVIGFMLYQSE
ncbi:PREDICTED: protein odr-4 homolog [Camelina sativa]|uniref:Protein odr-4 homolog n=1 Tax=Camelina sativa TaxID=90675 RepID=A0ABM0TFH0_CAMSA|nr:PREDICTED: protein odr-4 homolog [Camelina sativa]XP_010425647.1 PREDICTED: protein odr-4 homolog [Camelina sativa]